MLELHYEGVVYPLKDDYTIREVFDTMRRRSQHSGTTWFHLRSGGRVHLAVDERPRFAVQVAAGYDEYERELEASRTS